MEPNTPSNQNQPNQPDDNRPDNRPQGQNQNQNRNQRYRSNNAGDHRQAGQNQRPAGSSQNQGGNRPPGNSSGGQNGQSRPPRENGVSNAMSRQRKRLAQQGPQHTDLLPSVDMMPINKSRFNGSSGAQQSKVKNPQRGPANQAVREDILRVMSLGGLGEIGKNMSAVELGNDILIIDMGFGFPDEKQPGVDYIIPDVTYLERNKHKVRGIVITHGHMDHIGGSGYMIPKFPVPLYGSRLSLAMVAKQIEEFKINTPQYIVLDPDKHERVQIGPFNLELVHVTHTIADSTAAVIRTAVGTIVHTGDWRPDPTPLDEKPMDMNRMEEIGKEGVLLLMGDSTSCDQVGRTTSERVVEPTIHDLFGRADGRIIISTFSSSVTRVQLIIDAANQAGRRLAIVGRSMLSTIELCIKLGYLRVPQGLIIKVQEASTLPDDKLVILCTGSQGEENAALVRMSTGDHQNVKIKPGDTVIFSSSVIPGNDVAIVRLVDNLMREGANVYARSTEALKGHGPVHVGGHAKHDDAGDLVALMKPKFYMPVHGEFHHLVYNAEAAVQNGVPQENVFVMDNGDVLEMTSTTAKRGARIPAGMVMVDGSGIGDVEGVVLRDRIALGSEGTFMIIATVSRKTGKLISSPDIISRGFIYMKDNEELINKTRAEVRRAFEKRTSTGPVSREEWNKFKLNLRDDVADYLYSQTKRNPMVLPVINEV